MTDSWSLVHAERAALVEDLRGLRPEQWELPSLCAGWSVHDVAAHLVDNALTTRLGFVRGLVRARFDFHRLNDAGIRRHRGATPAETLQRLEAAVHRTSGPPGPVDGRLVEEVVHGEDVRRPLGLHRDHSTESLERALRAQASTSAGFGGCKELVQRVQLVADDADVTVGSGPRACGRLVDVLLAACGRADGAQRLSGEGAALVLEAASPRLRGSAPAPWRVDVVISVGDWEHECCGPAVERNEVRGFSCARTTAEDGLEQLVEVRHGPFLDEQADVRVHGRVKDLRVVRDDGSQQPVLRIPSGRALRGFDAHDDGHLEAPLDRCPSTRRPALRRRPRRDRRCGRGSRPLSGRRAGAWPSA